MSLSHTARFSLCWKGWGQSPQRGKATRAAGSSNMGMSPQDGAQEREKDPKKHAGGFVTSLGAAESPQPRGQPRLLAPAVP